MTTERTLADVVPYQHEWPQPPGWRLFMVGGDGVAWRIPGGRRVIASGEILDDKRWVHLSQSHPSRLPTWPELVEMRDLLIGPEVEAYQVCPPASRYVNLHANVLHLWACLDGPALPQFDAVIGGVRTI